MKVNVDPGKSKTIVVDSAWGSVRIYLSSSDSDGLLRVWVTKLGGEIDHEYNEGVS